MANFDIAYALTIKNEGGYSNDPNDPGGETYRGIVRKYARTWAGWALVDAAKPLRQNQIINNARLEQLVKDWYRANKWNLAKGDDIRNQNVANFVFDTVVQHGRGGSVIQEGINDYRRSKNLQPIAVDNIIGPNTVAAINQAESNSLLNKLIQQRLDYMKSLPIWNTYARGFLNRLQVYAASVVKSPVSWAALAALITFFF